MAKISEHFNDKDFACNCKYCKGSLKISLGLIGALEFIRCSFNRRVNIIRAYRCPELNNELRGWNKSYHLEGKAADITVSGIPYEEVFKFIEKNIPEVKGLGLYPGEKFVHIDLRNSEEKQLWIYEMGKYTELTPEKRVQYHID